jgi:hypothetical protein
MKGGALERFNIENVETLCLVSPLSEHLKRKIL